MNATEVDQQDSAGGNRASVFLDIFGLSEEYKEADKITSLALDIYKHYIWVLCALGLPGNLITIITIVTMETINPATFFVSLLAALDGTSLLLKLIGHQLIKNGIYLGDVVCKCEFFVVYISTLSNWILVMICAERFFTVCFQTKKDQIFMMRNCYIAVAVLAVMFLALFGGISLPMRASDSTGQRCDTYIQHRWFWINIWYWINSILYLFIPSLCIIPMTVLMVWSLYFSHRKGVVRPEKVPDLENAASAVDNQGVSETELATDDAGFTIMIILAAMLFVILCLPACVFYLSYRGSANILSQAHWMLFQQVQFLLADSTHTINFFLYFLSARTFRQQVCRLFLCQPCRKTTHTFEHTDA